VFGVKGFQIATALSLVSVVCMKRLGVLIALEGMVSLFPKINAHLSIYVYAPTLSRRLDLSISQKHTEYPRLLHELSILRKVLGVSTVCIFSDLFSLILEQRLDL